MAIVYSIQKSLVRSRGNGMAAGIQRHLCGRLATCMATNACWRLNVRYGREPPIIGIIVNQRTGRDLFPRGKEELTIQSSEVNE